MLNRRQFGVSFLSGCCCLSCAGGSSLAQMWPNPQDRPAAKTQNGNRSLAINAGCSISGFGPGQLAQYQMRKTCGISSLDDQFSKEADILSEAYGVNPAFRFLMDLQGPNAYATPDLIEDGKEGCVLFGLQLLKNEMMGPSRENALIVIMAHEWGHILQYRNGYTRPSMNLELGADVMGGWWFGEKLRKVNARPDVLADAANRGAYAVYSKGDYAFFSVAHHGTPQQRLAAFTAGVQISMQGATANDAFDHSWQLFRF